MATTTLQGSLTNPRLEEMVLRNVVGLDSLEDFQPLMYLTTLRPGCMWKSNPGLVHLPRFSPNLMTLALYPDPNCPVHGFFGNVKEFCPKLTIIERAKHDGIDADEMNWSQEMDLALVGSTSYLVYIELPFSELSGEVCQAILDLHSGTLETLRLCLDV